jgi:hypothetical protein
VVRRDFARFVPYPESGKSSALPEQSENVIENKGLL